MTESLARSIRAFVPVASGTYRVPVFMQRERILYIFSRSCITTKPRQKNTIHAPVYNLFKKDWQSERLSCYVSRAMRGQK